MEKINYTLFDSICAYENFEKAYLKARKRKTQKMYVKLFEQDKEKNLHQLCKELRAQTYKPQQLTTFILRDPKTRKINKSAFRDRIVHHAICNIIEPIFDKTFIYDSYANRLRKGTHKAIKRFDEFKRKVSKNNTRACYVLKADIKQYFETVDHKMLLSLLTKKIEDEKLLNLIKTILNNYKTKVKGKGMPLGNLTSQFFANIYLNEMDCFIKHKLKAKHYLRYVDDFIVLHKNKAVLFEYKKKIEKYLIHLELELHPDKSKILLLQKGITLLGYRNFYHYKLLRKSNLRKFEKDFKEKLFFYEIGLLPYQVLMVSLQGWFGYAKQANTYKLRKDIIKRVNDLKKPF